MTNEDFKKEWLIKKERFGSLESIVEKEKTRLLSTGLFMQMTISAMKQNKYFENNEEKELGCRVSENIIDEYIFLCEIFLR